MGWEKSSGSCCTVLCPEPVHEKENWTKLLILIYCQTSLYEHPLNTDTSLFLTYSLFSPWGKKTLSFSLNSTQLIRRHPVNMDTFYGPLSSRIDGVWVYTFWIIWTLTLYNWFPLYLHSIGWHNLQEAGLKSEFVRHNGWWGHFY